MSDHAGELTPQDQQVRARALDLVNKLWDKPEFQKLAKTVDPALRTTADIAEPYVAPIRAELEVERTARNELAERITRFEKTQTDRDEDTAFRGKLDRAQSKFRLTDDGVAEVLTMMKERQLADPEAAAALWQANQPKPKPTTGSSLSPSSMAPAEILAGGRYGGGSIMSEESMKLLNTKPEDWMVQAAIEILQEPEQV